MSYSTSMFFVMLGLGQRADQWCLCRQFQQPLTTLSDCTDSSSPHLVCSSSAERRVIPPPTSSTALKCVEFAACEVVVLLLVEVLARSSPTDKFNLVKLLKKQGEIVAVTGAAFCPLAAPSAHWLLFLPTGCFSCPMTALLPTGHSFCPLRSLAALPAH